MSGTFFRIVLQDAMFQKETGIDCWGCDLSGLIRDHKHGFLFMDNNLSKSKWVSLKLYYNVPYPLRKVGIVLEVVTGTN